MTQEELTEFVISLGVPKYRAAQLYSWLMRGAVLEDMTDLPKDFRERLEAAALFTLPKVEQKLTSALDGTIKYLFQLHDGECIESVFMRYAHGNTLCISSQVGCAMGCTFCASTIGGKVRDLLASEMIGQVIAASADSGERISNIVIMGIGEPLDNYDNVIKFLHLVNAPGGLNIGYRHISLSTCGLVPQIRALAAENLPITLSISLHAADDDTRCSIMPVNKKYPLDTLLSTCRDYFQAGGRRISFEYTLISGKNDTPEAADALAHLLRRYFSSRGRILPLHVNLIPVNEVAERGYSRSARGAVDRFAEILNAQGINTTVRRRLGADINASCGQLRRSVKQNEENIPEQQKL